MKIGVTCAILQISGKYLISNKLSNSLESEYAISFDINWINFPKDIGFHENVIIMG